MKQIIFLLLTVLILFNCTGEQQNPTLIAFKNKNLIAKIPLQKDNLKLNTQFLKDFLEEPINLHEFKKRYGNSNSGNHQADKYYFQPVEKGFYYQYMLFHNLRFGKNPMCYLNGKTMNEGDLFNSFQIYVYHFGNSGSFDFYDKNEVLIGFRSAGIHDALGQANLVGKTLQEIEELFGNDYIDMGDIKIYQHNKRVLSLKIKSSKVEWIKYYHHSVNVDKENIPKHLLKFEENL